MKRFNVRRHLSYASVMATLALFFAMSGVATAGVKYLIASDTIPSTSDLAGSTYGNPLIAAGKVTTASIADGAITSSKFDSGATAPNASSIGGLNVVTVPFGDTLDPGIGAEGNQTECPGDRIAVHLALSAPADFSITSTTWARGYVDWLVSRTDGSTSQSFTLTLYCFGG